MYWLGFLYSSTVYYTIFGCTRKIKICNENFIHGNEFEISITYSVWFSSEKNITSRKVKYDKNLKENDSDLGGFTGKFGGFPIIFYITELSKTKIQGRYMVFDFCKEYGTFELQRVENFLEKYSQY